jgi:hypothetical protein
MFLNANSGAKASQDMAARFLKAKAAKARALARANGEVVEDTLPNKPVRKSLTGTESTWLSERHEKLRTDAIQNIQKAITKQEELKGALSNTLERLVEVAHARLQCSNERGMYTCTHLPARKWRRRLTSKSKAFSYSSLT